MADPNDPLIRTPGQLPLPFDGARALADERAQARDSKPQPPALGRTADRRAGPRKLHIGHIAFMRAVVQGIDPRQSWIRYLQTEGDSSDVRQVRSTITWIRDEFAAAAKRHGRFATARLVRLDLERVEAAAKASGRPKVALMSLEDFALERGLEDFSYAEQLEAYTEYQTEQGGAAQADLSRSKRRERIVQRQLEALLWLEQLVGEPPAAGDSVSAWLNPDLARRLEAAGILTLSQLADRINGIGRRWYVPLRALGPAKAERIEAWMRDHAPTTGLVLGPHVALPRHAVDPSELATLLRPAAAMRPLHKLALPPELDGSVGANRRPAHESLIPAANDIQAIASWLQSKARRANLGSNGTSLHEPGAEALDTPRALVPSPSAQFSILEAKATELTPTQRCYRKEAERFLLWAVLERRKPMSSMTAEDCSDYLAFLADPQPHQRWCAPRSRERWSPLWRPFEGPQGTAAQRAAHVALRQLHAFLVDHRYLTNNPWSASLAARAPSRLAAQRETSSSPVPPWDIQLERLAALPPCSATVRLAFVPYLLREASLTMRQASLATVDDLTLVGVGPEDASTAAPLCGLQIQGRGGRPRTVALSGQTIDLLRLHLTDRGLSPDLKNPANRGAHLIGKISDVDSRQPGAAAMLQRTGRHWQLPDRASVGADDVCGEAVLSCTANAVAPVRQGIRTHTLSGLLRRFYASCAGAASAEIPIDQGDACGRSSPSA